MSAPGRHPIRAMAYRSGRRRPLLPECRGLCGYNGFERLSAQSGVQSQGGVQRQAGVQRWVGEPKRVPWPGPESHSAHGTPSAPAACTQICTNSAAPRLAWGGFARGAVALAARQGR